MCPVRNVTYVSGRSLSLTPFGLVAIPAFVALFVALLASAIAATSGTVVPKEEHSLFILNDFGGRENIPVFIRPAHYKYSPIVEKSGSMPNPRAHHWRGGCGCRRTR